MKVIVARPAQLGIPLSEAEYGSVVYLPINGEYYMVISLMDGTGEKKLVRMESGVLKHFNKDTRVIPVRAVVHIGIDFTTELAS